MWCNPTNGRVDFEHSWYIKIQLHNLGWTWSLSADQQKKLPHSPSGSCMYGCVQMRVSDDSPVLDRALLPSSVRHTRRPDPDTWSWSSGRTGGPTAGRRSAVWPGLCRHISEKNEVLTEQKENMDSKQIDLLVPLEVFNLGQSVSSDYCFCPFKIWFFKNI